MYDELIFDLTIVDSSHEIIRESDPAYGPLRGALSSETGNHAAKGKIEVHIGLTQDLEGSINALEKKELRVVGIHESCVSGSWGVTVTCIVFGLKNDKEGPLFHLGYVGKEAGDIDALKRIISKCYDENEYCWHGSSLKSKESIYVEA